MILQSPIAAVLYAIYEAAPTIEEALAEKWSKPPREKNPDPDEIADMCSVIREEWSDHDLQARQVSLGHADVRRLVQFWNAVRERDLAFAF